MPRIGPSFVPDIFFFLYRSNATILSSSSISTMFALPSNAMSRPWRYTYFVMTLLCVGGTTVPCAGIGGPGL